MRKLKAFTLVELLVVISIIAILLAILMPTLGKAKELGRRIVCGNNLKTMAMGDQLYANESGDWHVPLVNGLSPNNELWFQNPLFMKLVAMKGRVNTEEQQGYVAETLPKEYKCPTDKRTVANGGLSKDGQHIQGSSYGINGMSLYSNGATGYLKGGWHYYELNAPDFPRLAHCLKVLQVVSPSRKFFMMDSQWHVVHWDGSKYQTVWDKHGDKMGSYFWDAISYRHSEGLNMMFYDWHAKYLKKQEVWKYTGTTNQQRVLNAQSWVPITFKLYIDTPPTPW